MSIAEYLALLTSPRVVNIVAERTGNHPERSAAILNTYAAECRYGLDQIASHLPPRGRILEVGAGLGMLSSYLRMLGHDIVALEPCTSGFDFFSEIQSVIREVTSSDTPFLHIRAEELNPAQHGTFPFIFSVNVLEHMPDLAGAMRGMASVLTPDGSMWHTCPNYVFPYEPHFGLPLIPLFPEATRFLLPRRISTSELWRSLNFITYFGLKRLSQASGLAATFRPGTMAAAFRRFDLDQQFAARQRIGAAVYRTLKAIGGVSALEALPAAVSTPMVVSFEFKANTRAAGRRETGLPTPRHSG